MEEKGRAETSLSSQFTPFKSRLLAVGSDVDQDFALIQQLYPVECTIFDQAINQLARRVQRDGGGAEQAETTRIEALTLLGQTLTPFVRAFFASHGLNDHESDPDVFREYARSWAVSQVKSCCQVAAMTVVHDYHLSLTTDLLTNDEMVRMRHIRDQIQQFGDWPEAQRLIERLRQQLRELTVLAESKVAIDPSVARSLSYLLSCRSGGLLTDVAAAAMIMKGNDSPGARAVRTPVQILEVGEVATMFDRDSRSLTNAVSKLRNQAMKSDEIGHFAAATNAHHLWLRLDPPSGPNEEMRR